MKFVISEERPNFLVYIKELLINVIKPSEFSKSNLGFPMYFSILAEDS